MNLMIVVAFFSWWYGSGWRQEARAIGRSIDRLSDTFSIGLLLVSLFAPFRQISVGAVSGSLEARVRAWADKLISRCIGAMVRSTMILIGVVAISLTAVLGMLRLTFWPLLPFMPLLGIILSAAGWVPWQN